MSGELHTALTAYVSSYREGISIQTIDVWSLVQLLERFVETDREFQAWWRIQGGAGARPTTG